MDLCEFKAKPGLLATGVTQRNPVLETKLSVWGWGGTKFFFFNSYYKATWGIKNGEI